MRLKCTRKLPLLLISSNNKYIIFKFVSRINALLWKLHYLFYFCQYNFENKEKNTVNPFDIIYIWIAIPCVFQTFSRIQ
jgi:hypothetical protein